MAGIEIAKKEDLKTLETNLEQIGDELELKASLEDLGQKADSTHTHVWTDITDAPEIPDTSDLATKGELSTGLGGKADTGHTHDYDDLTGKPSIPSIDGLASQADLDVLQGVVEALQAEVEALKGETEPEE